MISIAHSVLFDQHRFRKDLTEKDMTKLTDLPAPKPKLPIPHPQLIHQIVVSTLLVILFLLDAPRDQISVQDNMKKALSRSLYMQDMIQNHPENPL
jgi:hypothetical protein